MKLCTFHQGWWRQLPMKWTAFTFIENEATSILVQQKLENFPVLKVVVRVDWNSDANFKSLGPSLVPSKYKISEGSEVGNFFFRKGKQIYQSCQNVRMNISFFTITSVDWPSQMNTLGFRVGPDETFWQSSWDKTCKSVWRKCWTLSKRYNLYWASGK